MAQRRFWTKQPVIFALCLYGAVCKRADALRSAGQATKCGLKQKLLTIDNVAQHKIGVTPPKRNGGTPSIQNGGSQNGGMPPTREDRSVGPFQISFRVDCSRKGGCRSAYHVDKERHTLLCLIGSGKSHIAGGNVIKGDDDDRDWALEGPSFPGNGIGNEGLCVSLTIARHNCHTT